MRQGTSPHLAAHGLKEPSSRTIPPGGIHPTPNDLPVVALRDLCECSIDLFHKSCCEGLSIGHGA